MTRSVQKAALIRSERVTFDDYTSSFCARRYQRHFIFVEIEAHALALCLVSRLCCGVMRAGEPAVCQR